MGGIHLALHVTARFITLEGGEGVGKSTQLRLLAELLEERGIACVATREPGGSPGAELVRQVLLGGDVDRWSAGPEALLFAAARGDHVEKTIRPAIERGAWVICDRFVDSSRAYQGIAGQLGDDAIMAMHAIGSGGLLPDRTIVLSLSADEARQRARARDADGGDRFEQKDHAYHKAVVDAFESIAAGESNRVRLVDATGDVAKVHRRIVAELADLLP
ncbi:dTMP kinase [Sphingorhabdus soli]|uniref:Thymidylate kinase n=1 Tax=Flavisphingopyxis soli TaxID=2601267 RepID=A0A5C6UBI4_9SPHN|nr:dTMP kinase [Sphingorhabdus soli]TXC69168.1 dTMP kinase [Sphingorhabdus soli]